MVLLLVYDLLSVDKFVILSRVFLTHMLVPGTHLRIHSLQNYENRKRFVAIYGLPDKEYDHEYAIADCLLTADIYEADA